LLISLIISHLWRIINSMWRKLKTYHRNLVMSEVSMKSRKKLRIWLRCLRNLIDIMLRVLTCTKVYYFMVNQVLVKHYLPDQSQEKQDANLSIVLVLISMKCLWVLVQRESENFSIKLKNINLASYSLMRSIHYCQKAEDSIKNIHLLELQSTSYSQKWMDLKRQKILWLLEQLIMKTHLTQPLLGLVDLIRKFMYLSRMLMEEKTFSISIWDKSKKVKILKLRNWLEWLLDLVELKLKI